MKIAVISDIHEDIVSLKKALKIIEIEKCDQIICLGDILGYPYFRGKYEATRNASECINIIRKNCSIVLTGNHDLFHIRKIPQHRSGYKFPDNWYDLTPEEKTQVSMGRIWNYSDDYAVKLSEKEIEYIKSLSEFAIKVIGEKKILFSHYVYPNFTGYISNKYADDREFKAHFGLLRQKDCELSICGHMHIEGLGVCNEPVAGFFPNIFKGFIYYSFGEKKLNQNRLSCVTIPALADNSQVNGFAIFNSMDFSINALSLNTNRRFIL